MGLLEWLAERGFTLGAAGIWTLVAMLGVALMRWAPAQTKASADARKTKAEADRIDAEADDVVAATLERQVARLERRVSYLESEVTDCHQDRDLALAAARYLWDRLHAVAPNEEAVGHLRDYLAKPPGLTTPRAMREQIDRLKDS